MGGAQQTDHHRRRDCMTEPAGMTHHLIGLAVDGFPHGAIRAITKLLDNLVPNGGYSQGLVKITSTGSVWATELMMPVS